ncbi:MAG: Hsp33 family molecular chaperone HslO [Peptococcaceae bacterium]|nr:Hsp33 family molecular chaperone HslO [Peptococcaceae bacterium]
MQDELLVATVAGGSARIIVTTTTHLVEEARQRHDTYPTASAALGRTLTAGLLLASNLKGNDTLTIRIMGDGPLGSIIVSANAWSAVRGYVQNPHTHLPANAVGKLDVGGAVGKGSLYVSRDLGFGEPYTGSVELVTGEIAEDIAQYLATSEQTPAAVALGVLVDTDNSVIAAGGFLVQMMPGATEETIAILEANIKAFGPITNVIASGTNAEGILHLLTNGLPMVLHEKRPVNFTCYCSKEKLEGILLSFGKEEIRDIIVTQRKAEITCHFCGDEYVFNQAELEDLIERIERQTI